MASQAAAAGSVESESATFIFKGTVRKTPGSTMPEVKADARTAVVRIDEVLQAAPVMAKYAGREITVLFPEGQKPKANAQAVYYTMPWRFGTSVAVRALEQRPVTDPGPVAGRAAAAHVAPLAAPAAGAAAAPVARHEDHQLRRSLDAADLVVTGTVSAVRTTAAPAVAAGGAAAPRHRISEHDAIWHEAVIDVTAVHKGQAAQKQIVVRFPSSNDVRWRFHPKFRAGQDGIFLLKRGKGGTAEAMAGATAAGAAAAPLQPQALESVSNPQPLSALPRIRELLAMGAGS